MEVVEDHDAFLNDSNNSDSSSTSENMSIQKERQIECEKDLIGHLDMLPHDYDFDSVENRDSSLTSPAPGDQLNKISALDNTTVDVDCTLSLGNLAYDAYQYHQVPQPVAEENRETESNKNEENADQEVENVAVGRSVFRNFMPPAAAAAGTTSQRAFGEGTSGSTLPAFLADAIACAFANASDDPYITPNDLKDIGPSNYPHAVRFGNTIYLYTIGGGIEKIEIGNCSNTN